MGTRSRPDLSSVLLLSLRSMKQMSLRREEIFLRVPDARSETNFHIMLAQLPFHKFASERIVLNDQDLELSHEIVILQEIHPV